MRLVVMWQSRLETVVATPTLFEHSAQCRQDERSRGCYRQVCNCAGSSCIQCFAALRPTAADATDPQLRRVCGGFASTEA
jgi:hypothetical protein